MILTIDSKYELGQKVYLDTDTDQRPRIVTGIIIQPNSGLLYQLSQGSMVSNHYECEISEEVNIMTKTSSD